eukprot:1152030-Pelagomonas_calceolata.AAC.3
MATEFPLGSNSKASLCCPPGPDKPRRAGRAQRRLLSLSLPLTRFQGTPFIKQSLIVCVLSDAQHWNHMPHIAPTLLASRARDSCCDPLPARAGCPVPHGGSGAPLSCIPDSHLGALGSSDGGCSRPQHTSMPGESAADLGPAQLKTLGVGGYGVVVSLVLGQLSMRCTHTHTLHPHCAASSPASAASAAAPVVQELSRVALEAAFKPRLEDFDLLLTLRPEALPRVRAGVRT